VVARELVTRAGAIRAADVYAGSWAGMLVVGSLAGVAGADWAVAWRSASARLMPITSNAHPATVTPVMHVPKIRPTPM
jgi:hypothetical protein